ncbi:hypothetical protein HDU67_001034 [Dinochytrium kinnereticum]|nr:hypothetical protein HDU67_001034 [Dinochytrium kinnereticum]
MGCAPGGVGAVEAAKAGEEIRFWDVTPLPFSYQTINEGMLDLLNYDFSLERAVLQEAEAEARESLAASDRHRQLEETRKERKLAETRAKAPGFTGDNNVILQPKPAAGSKAKVVVEAEKGGDGGEKEKEVAAISADRIAARRGSGEIGKDVKPKPATSPFNFAEFEHGLAPLDPWDTRQDDFTALREVIGGTSPPPAPSSIPTRSRTLPPHHHPINQPYGTSPPVTSNMYGPPPSSASLDSFGGRQQQQQQQQYFQQQPPPPQQQQQQLQQGYAPGMQYQTAPPPPPPKPSGLRNQFGSPEGPPRGPPEALQLPKAENTPVMPLGIPAKMETVYQSYISMGFSPEGIASAFRVHREDESKHLDYLVAFDQLVSEGRTPDAADHTLDAVGHKDMTAASKFALALEEICELGFATEKVVEALKEVKGDRERALEKVMRI